MMGKRCLSETIQRGRKGGRDDGNVERVESYTENRVMEHKYFHFKCKRYDDLHDVLL